VRPAAPREEPLDVQQVVLVARHLLGEHPQAPRWTRTPATVGTGSPTSSSNAKETE
jgi:hypothetical protein